MTVKADIVEGERLYRTDWLIRGIWVDLDVIFKFARTRRYAANQKREDSGGLRNCVGNLEM